MFPRQQAEPGRTRVETGGTPVNACNMYARSKCSDEWMHHYYGRTACTSIYLPVALVCSCAYFTDAGKRCAGSFLLVEVILPLKDQQAIRYEYGDRHIGYIRLRGHIRTLQLPSHRVTEGLLFAMTDVRWGLAEKLRARSTRTHQAKRQVTCCQSRYSDPEG